uniref:Uncharacterized protein n=1 Tax=Lactuca sativa TaxID=4236 RepID=A0A9R1W497_LACSA|nr:hypothetical protein LSAT_V11C300146020 [Lactuca sativa]
MKRTLLPCPISSVIQQIKGHAISHSYLDFIFSIKKKAYDFSLNVRFHLVLSISTLCLCFFPVSTSHLRKQLYFTFQLIAIGLELAAVWEAIYQPHLLSQFKITKRDGVCHFVFSFSLKFVFLPLYVNLFAELYVLKRRMELYALKVVINPINRSKKKGEELCTPTFFTCLANEYERRHMSASSIAR